jgi:hypothetical protein
MIAIGSYHANRKSGLECAIDLGARLVEPTRHSDSYGCLGEQLDARGRCSTRCITPKRSHAFDELFNVDRSLEIQHCNPFRTI